MFQFQNFCGLVEDGINQTKRIFIARMLLQPARSKLSVITILCHPQKLMCGLFQSQFRNKIGVSFNKLFFV